MEQGRETGKRRRLVISCTECHRRKQKCDRCQPCSHCTKRDKVHLCVYESQTIYEDVYEASTSENLTDPGRPYASSQSEWFGKSSDSLPTRHNLGDELGYSPYSTTGTLEIIRKVDAPQTRPKSQSSCDSKDAAELALKYKNLVRQLPSKGYADILVRRYFSDVAWFYDIIDADQLQRQLQNWYQISYSAFVQGPMSLQPEVRALPALLFQIYAQALLFLPLQSNAELEGLKYAPGLAFIDLAAEYSDTGNEILSVLGSRDPTTARVQAGLLRASFQKSTGSVVEAWHSLGRAIKDAQEMGLHCMSGPGVKAATAHGHDPLHELRNAELRDKVWLVLHLWDSHMSVVLGRPMSTKLDPSAVGWAFDATQGLREAVLGEVRGHGRPTGFSLILHGYHAAYRYLQDIHDLEVNGVKPGNYPAVKEIDAAIAKNIGRLPAWARVENPNTAFDKASDCLWLPAARETLMTEVYFVLLALHRPYIFSFSFSRNGAFEAAMQILDSQSRLFAQMEPRQYTAFNLVFATFDAIVLLAAILLLYPRENAGRCDAAVRGIEWGLARLEAMGDRNKLAASALATTKALYAKLRVRTAATDAMSQDLASAGRVPPSVTSSNDQSLDLSAEDSWPPPGLFQGGTGSEYPTLDAQSFGTIQPPQPLHDLVFQHISTAGLNADSFPAMDTGFTPHQDLGGTQDVSHDDFWRMMNDFMK